MALLDLQEAIQLIDQGEAEEAIPLLTAWTQQMPTYAAVHVVLARAYEAAHQWDEAKSAWQEAHFLMPNSPAVREGLARIRTVSASPTAAEDDRLMMDLDLQAELEATLEALFNPFTLPHQAEDSVDAVAEEAVADEPVDEEQGEAVAMVEAALAAAADPVEEQDAEQEITVEESLDAEQEITVEEPSDEDVVFVEDEDLEEPEAIAEEESLAETISVADPEEAEDQPSIYDEIEQLIEEKEGRQGPESLEEEIAPEVSELEPQDVAETLEQPEEVTDEPSIYDEIEELIEQKEAATEDIHAPEIHEDEADAVLGGWQEFDEEPEEAPMPDGQDVDDLERLISELESARIVPQPELEDVAPPDLNDDIEDVVSETLARIFASQEQYSEAARVYEQLALQHPEDAERFNQLAAEMHTRADEE